MRRKRRQTYAHACRARNKTSLPAVCGSVGRSLPQVISPPKQSTSSLPSPPFAVSLCRPLRLSLCRPLRLSLLVFSLLWLVSRASSDATPYVLVASRLLPRVHGLVFSLQLRHSSWCWLYPLCSSLRTHLQVNTRCAFASRLRRVCVAFASRLREVARRVFRPQLFQASTRRLLLVPSTHPRLKPSSSPSLR